MDRTIFLFDLWKDSIPVFSKGRATMRMNIYQKDNSGARRRRLRHQETGFTLVELLVVIAVITILAGLLLPALDSALQSARDVYCKNNLKQQYTMLTIYENDYGVLPAALTQDPDNVYRYWGGRLRNAGLLDVTWDTYYKAVAGNCKVLDCPTYVNQTDLDKYGFERSNYGFNSQLSRLVSDATEFGGAGETNPRAGVYIQSSRVSKPSSRILLGSSSYMCLDGVNTYLAPNGWAAYPHHEKMNVLFLDSHVDSYLIDTLQQWEVYRGLFGIVK